MDAGKDLVQRTSEEDEAQEERRRRRSAMEDGFWEAKWGAADRRHRLGRSENSWGWRDREGEAEARNRSCVCGGDESPSAASESSSSLSSTNRAETHSSFSAASSESVLPCSPIDHRRRNASPFIRGEHVLSPPRPQIGYHNYDDDDDGDDHGYGGGSSEYSGSITGYFPSPGAVHHVVDSASPAAHPLRHPYHRAWDDGAAEDSGTDSDSWASASSSQLLDADDDEDDGKGGLVEITERSAGAAVADDHGDGETMSTTSSSSLQGCPRTTDEARSSIQCSNAGDGRRLAPARHDKASRLWRCNDHILKESNHLSDDDAAAVLAATRNVIRPWPCATMARSTCRLSTPVATPRFSSSFSQGFLRFAGERDGGSPCYSFSAAVASFPEVLFARAHRLDEVDREAEDQWMYTFYSRRDQQERHQGSGRASRMRKKGEAMLSAPVLLGKMRVFRMSRGGESGDEFEDANIIETQFVLYCEDEEEMGDGALAAASDGDEENRGGIMSSSWKKKLDKTQREEQQQRHLNQRRSGGSSGEVKKSRCRKTELAAIVISSRYVKKERQPTDVSLAKKSLQAMDVPPNIISGEERFAATTTSTSLVKNVDRETGKSHGGAGWGVGFLKEADNSTSSAEKGGWGMRFLLDRSSAVHVQMMKMSSQRRTADVTVILPAGYHGLPQQHESESAVASGPTPLLERWRSGGGGCDCGGWDMGCGLSLLKSDTFQLPHKRSGIALTRHDHLLSWPTPLKPFTISTQGRDPVVLLSMDVVEAGLFSLRFQAPRFTTLQAFATAVAILHQQQQLV